MLILRINHFSRSGKLVFKQGPRYSISELHWQKQASGALLTHWPLGDGHNFKSVISEHLWLPKFMSSSCEIAPMGTPQNAFDDKSTMVQMMAACRKATISYLSECWPRPVSPFGIAGPPCLLFTPRKALHYALVHYDDVIMTMLASQITSPTVVYSIVYSGVNQRKYQSSASLAFVREIDRGPVNFPHKWPVTRKMFPFDDVIMIRHMVR